MSLVTLPLEQLRTAAQHILTLTDGVENLPIAAHRLRRQVSKTDTSLAAHDAMALALEQIDVTVHYTMQLFITLYLEGNHTEESINGS